MGVSHFWIRLKHRIPAANTPRPFAGEIAVVCLQAIVIAIVSRFGPVAHIWLASVGELLMVINARSCTVTSPWPWKRPALLRAYATRRLQKPN